MDRSILTTLRAIALAAAVGLAIGKAALAASDIEVGPASRSVLTLTVYNQDLALVAEQRRFEAPQGRSVLHLTGISPMILPGSVDLAAAGFDIVEQSYHFDLLTPRRLLEASLGQTVRIARINPATGEETIEEATVLDA